MSVDVHQGESGTAPESVSTDTLKCNGLLCTGYICGNVFMKIRLLFPEILEPNCGKCPRNVGESFTKFLDSDPDA